VESPTAPPVGRREQPDRLEFAQAVDAFLSQRDLLPSTARSYRQTLAAIIDVITDDAPPAAEAIERAVVARWDACAPATWNRHVATVGSFLHYSERHGLLPHLEPRLDRRRERVNDTRALSRSELERIWRLEVPVREKALWRLCYETAARASEALSLNIEDLDLANHSADLVGKGGHRAFLIWQTGTARLLPRVIGGRTRGPLFIGDRRPRLPVASQDLCPRTGRARLSYRRAAELFQHHTGHTLHQLRHSALTHLAEDNVALPLLMAVSRHTSLQSLQRYARPGRDAVAKLAAQRDPLRRGR
jgi:integrase